MLARTTATRVLSCGVSAAPLLSLSRGVATAAAASVPNPRPLHRAIGRAPVRPEDTASYHARIHVLKHDPNTVAAEHSAAAAVPASPLESAMDGGNATAGSVETAVALVPGEEAYSGQRGLPASPLDDSVFRSQASRAVAKSSRHNIHVSPTKLNDICRTVRGVSVTEALIQLRLSHKQKSAIVADLISAAAIGAVHNHNMDRKRLYVSELWVGHGQHLKRMDIKGRGRCGIKLRYRSHLNVELREQGADPEHYKGTWKGGGRSHDAQGRELRIGRIGPLLSTVQRTLEHMQQWRTARGMQAAVPGRKDREQREVDAKRAMRASGIATDFDLVFGPQDPEQTRAVPTKSIAGAKPKRMTELEKLEAAEAEQERQQQQQQEGGQ